MALVPLVSNSFFLLKFVCYNFRASAETSFECNQDGQTLRDAHEPSQVLMKSAVAFISHRVHKVSQSVCVCGVYMSILAQTYMYSLWLHIVVQLFDLHNCMCTCTSIQFACKFTMSALQTLLEGS